MIFLLLRGEKQSDVACRCPVSCCAIFRTSALEFPVFVMILISFHPFSNSWDENILSKNSMQRHQWTLYPGSQACRDSFSHIKLRSTQGAIIFRRKAINRTKGLANLRRTKDRADWGWWWLPTLQSSITTTSDTHQSPADYILDVGDRQGSRWSECRCSRYRCSLLRNAFLKWRTPASSEIDFNAPLIIWRHLHSGNVGSY